MSTRRRIGVSAATTEAARRQLMAKVPCWEKVWTLPENAAPGSTLKVYKWVKTDTTQQFSDDEDEANEPLAPLPDEPEVAEVEGDEDMDQDDLPPADSLQQTPRALLEPPEVTDVPKESETEDLSKPPSPKPHPLSISYQPEAEADDVLDESFAVVVGVDDVNQGVVDLGALDMSALGPDGTAFEEAHDLSQMEGGDAIMGAGVLMDQTVDPFAESLVE